VSWDSTGDLLATGSWDASVAIWDVETRTRRQVVLQDEDTDRVQCCAWSSDTGAVAIGSNAGTVQLIDGRVHKHAGKMYGHTNWVSGVAWHSDGYHLASASGDGTMRIWDTRKLLFLWATDARSGSVQFGSTRDAWFRSCSCARDEGLVAVASDRGQTQVWSIHAHCPVSSFDVGCCYGVTWAHTSDKLAVSLVDGSVQVWDLSPEQRDAPQQLLQMKQAHVGHARSVSWRPVDVSLNGTMRGMLVSGGSDCALLLHDAEDGELVATAKGHESTVLSVAWSPDGDFVASGSVDHTARVWLMPDKTCDNAAMKTVLEKQAERRRSSVLS